jgi:hypothetical protein
MKIEIQGEKQKIYMYSGRCKKTMEGGGLIDERECGW